MPYQHKFSAAVFQAILLLALSAALAFGSNVITDGPSLLTAGKPELAAGLRSVSIEEARALNQDASAIFLDVRDAFDYLDSHIPGAASLPIERAPADNTPLTIVVYCSDKSCSKATMVAEKLQKGGFEIAVMPSGASGWATQGGEMEMSQ